MAHRHSTWAEAAARTFLEQAVDLSLRSWATDGMQETIICLVAALGHLCDREGLDFGTVIGQAEGMYQMEVEQMHNEEGMLSTHDEGLLKGVMKALTATRATADDYAALLEAAAFEANQLIENYVKPEDE